MPWFHDWSMMVAGFGEGHERWGLGKKTEAVWDVDFICSLLLKLKSMKQI